MATIDKILDRYDLKTLEGALARRRQREKRVMAEVQKKRRKLEAELEKLASMGGSGRRTKGGPAKATKAGKIKRKPNARRLNDISLAEALTQVMQARKKPIHYKELTDTVQKRDLYRTKSKNLLSTVAVTLKRDGRFKKVEPGMYTLR